MRTRGVRNADSGNTLKLCFPAPAASNRGQAGLHSYRSRLRGAPSSLVSPCHSVSGLPACSTASSSPLQTCSSPPVESAERARFARTGQQHTGCCGGGPIALNPNHQSGVHPVPRSSLVSRYWASRHSKQLVGSSGVFREMRPAKGGARGPKAASAGGIHGGGSEASDSVQPPRALRRGTRPARRLRSGTAASQLGRGGHPLLLARHAEGEL